MDNSGWIPFEEAEPNENDCLMGFLLIWHVFRGVVVEAYEHRHDTDMYTHWMAIPRRGWVASVERKPAKEDADVMNCVLARHAYDGIIVTGWRRFEEEKRLTHWRRTPEPPTDRAKYRERF